MNPISKLIEALRLYVYHVNYRTGSYIDSANLYALEICLGCINIIINYDTLYNCFTQQIHIKIELSDLVM